MAGFIEMAKKGGQDTMQKIKESSDIMKINLLIQEEEEKQKDYFMSIGHVYYEQAINGMIRVEESLQDLVMEIGESDKKIEQYKEEIKKQKNVRVCLECHNECSDDSVFCSKCGIRLQSDETGAVNYCPKCGVEIGEDDLFCFNCGSRIE